MFRADDRPRALMHSTFCSVLFLLESRHPDLTQFEEKHTPNQPNLKSRHCSSDEGDSFLGRKVKQADLSCHVSSTCTLLK